MTIDAVRNYFDETVKPTIIEFLSDSSNLRKGRLAAIVLYHTWDYLGLSGDKGRPEKILVIDNEILMAETIRAAANSSKHFQLKSPHIAKSADQLVAEKNEGLFCAPFPDACFGEANEVYLLLNEDEQKKYGCKIVKLATAVRFMQSYWEKELKK
ncbi:hypothetical protein [Pseudomonas aeruginosa]|uniref:hypothetical protein n=1 Tax=Pseudomonas aeruginosa TaxID=287 RepID=UPI000FF83F04|nr:hypothetical protein [Pseudomonas aeruginosa]RWY34133.1 hypothetical protein EQH74_10790 [Pseudomonas aeruginosa]